MKCRKCDSLAVAVALTIPSPPHTLDPNAPREKVGEIADLCPDCFRTTYGKGGPSLYDEAAALGLPMDHNSSDLYLKCSPQADALVRKHDTNRTATRFRSNADGALWWDVPFMYAPWWRERDCTA